ncbi:hypothetical protein CCMA1212_008532 [Trichoderma ghanense]|uniref:Uncharacterized protein n=1 Tax=Trichoderma ghanense TaxID=65468 RepID=A0ABY2GUQ5_9HYPO
MALLQDEEIVDLERLAVSFFFLRRIISQGIGHVYGHNLIPPASVVGVVAAVRDHQADAILVSQPGIVAKAALTRTTSCLHFRVIFFWSSVCTLRSFSFGRGSYNGVSVTRR